MKIMNININFKLGLRRIVIVFIGLCVIFSICCYIGSGCMFDQYAYVEKIKIVNTKNNKTISLYNYLEEYWHNDKKYVGYHDIECHPYKQYCLYDEWEYRRNSKIKLENPYNKEKIILNIYAPSPIQYFFWQLWDFIKIFLIAGIVYGIYLLIELVFCWIIKGFKQ